jgi:uncharacterized protein
VRSSPLDPEASARVNPWSIASALITLGVADHSAFYERLGRRVALEVEETVFFQAGGLVVSLWSRDKLAQDGGVTDGGGWGGVPLAPNVRSEADVDGVIEEARAARGHDHERAGKTSWGGHTDVFIEALYR